MGIDLDDDWKKLLSDDGPLAAAIPGFQVRDQQQQMMEAVGEAIQNHSAAVIEAGTGVGKTLVAKEIHIKSENKDSPFVEINCSSLPEHLIEAELFGVEKGAYTGADSSRAGLVEVADGGLLILEE